MDEKLDGFEEPLTADKFSSWQKHSKLIIICLTVIILLTIIITLIVLLSGEEGNEKKR